MTSSATAARIGYRIHISSEPLHARIRACLSSLNRELPDAFFYGDGRFCTTVTQENKLEITVQALSLERTNSSFKNVPYLTGFPIDIPAMFSTLIIGKLNQLRNKYHHSTNAFRSGYITKPAIQHTFPETQRSTQPPKPF